MDLLDKNLASPLSFPGSHPSEPVNTESKNALIFGKQDLSDEIIDLLERQNITYEKITDFIDLNKTGKYYYLFAVDDNDFENLLACTFCEKVMGITKRIAICNCFENIKVFRDNHIPFLCGYSITADSLVSELIPPVNSLEEI
jgi:hypothetical protein